MVTEKKTLHNNQVLLLPTNTEIYMYHQMKYKMTMNVPCKTYNLKLLHFIKTNALTKP